MKASIANKMIAVSMVLTMAVLTLAMRPFGITPEWQEPIGNTMTGCASCRHSTDGDLEEAELNATGTGTFQYVDNSVEGDPNPWSDMAIVSLNISGTHPTLGTYSITNDPSKTTQYSRYSSNVASGFPAIGDMYMNILVTFEDQPDVVYEGIDLLHLRNDNIIEWPHNNTPFTQVGEVRLIRQGEGGEVVARLLNGDVEITACGG